MSVPKDKAGIFAKMNNVLAHTDYIKNHSSDKQTKAACFPHTTHTRKKCNTMPRSPCLPSMVSLPPLSGEKSSRLVSTHFPLLRYTHMCPSRSRVREGHGPLLF